MNTEIAKGKKNMWFVINNW